MIDSEALYFLIKVSVRLFVCLFVLEPDTLGVAAYQN